MAPLAPAPLRVLTLSSLFPSTAKPVFGLFVARQTQALAALPNTEVQVVAPMGLPPWPMSLAPQYRAMSKLAPVESWAGLKIWRPCFRHWPGSDGRFDVTALVKILTPLLEKIRQDFPFDVMDAQYFFPDGPAALALGKHFDVPVSIKARGADVHYWGHRPVPGRAIRKAGQAANGLLAVSAALKADMVQLGLPEDRIRVHYTGVDLTLFRPLDRAQAKAHLGIYGPFIASLGALIPRKQQALLLEALTALPDAQLAFIGDGPDQARLKALAQQLGVSGRVIWTGALPPADVALWLAAADVMALTSASEGLANAWVEALACGTPILITDVGGAREVLTDDKAGRIVPQDAKAIAAAISSLICDPPSQQLCRSYAARFTWANNAQALRDHLSALVRK
ncbi:MAG: glycosyltransferase family 4 protein [Sphingomonadaceae bacterium]|jgi:teichuronic acid biosynthesis glycosyltransferase TuaC|nr:glycosyltransferase family 4 protein [Sphingomonadaceae bacterium]NBU78495.1 glycosyltransferase family 4 protein [Sphingomonadaceae bacterium]NCA02337.1 glycosyltransferase family 4 protein [Sphingomonadaceae bacterium]